MTPRQRLTLLAAILGSGVAMLDGTIVNVALPAIERDLGGGLTAQQWVVNAYLLALVTEDEIAELIPCGPDLDAHLKKIEAFVEAGFDHVYVHQIGPDQAGFMDAYTDGVLSRARYLRPAAAAPA